MKITKSFPGLKQIENGDYVLEGNLVSEESIEIELDDRLVVRGKIETKKSIIAQLTVIAGEGIEAGCGIEAKQYIHAEKRIFAGISMYHTSQNCNKTIKCAELRKGEICYGDLVIEEPVVEMTIKEIEEKLGIKNLKIKEESK